MLEKNSCLLKRWTFIGKHVQLSRCIDTSNCGLFDNSHERQTNDRSNGIDEVRKLSSRGEGIIGGHGTQSHSILPPTASNVGTNHLQSAPDGLVYPLRYGRPLLLPRGDEALFQFLFEPAVALIHEECDKFRRSTSHEAYGRGRKVEGNNAACNGVVRPAKLVDLVQRSGQNSRPLAVE